jgi:hypothetical protein
MQLLIFLSQILIILSSCYKKPHLINLYFAEMIIFGWNNSGVLNKNLKKEICILRIWVTGGAGYIDSHTAKELAGARNHVLILDNFIKDTWLPPAGPDLSGQFGG